MEITDKSSWSQSYNKLLKDLTKDCTVLYDMLKKKPPSWTTTRTQVVQRIKLKVKELPCVNIPHP